MFYFRFFVIQKTGPSDFSTAIGINTFNIGTVLLWHDQLTEMIEWIKFVQNHINIGCIFNGYIDRIGLQYDMLSGMFIFIFIFLSLFFYFLFFLYVLFCGEMSNGVVFVVDILVIFLFLVSF